MTDKPKKIGKRQGTAVIYPAALEARYDISAPTRWRWEKTGKLPKRDFFIGGAAVGWKPETIAASETAPASAA